MAFIFVIIVELLISFALASTMVENRSGLAKSLTIGLDDKETIERMRRIATGQNSAHDLTELSTYTINVTFQNGQVVEKTIETQKTVIVFSDDNQEKGIFEKGMTESEAIWYLTRLICFSIFIINFIVICVIYE